jgi:hypothetical protein
MAVDSVAALENRGEAAVYRDPALVYRDYKGHREEVTPYHHEDSR